MPASTTKRPARPRKRAARKPNAKVRAAVPTPAPDPALRRIEAVVADLNETASQIAVDRAKRLIDRLAGPMVLP